MKFTAIKKNPYLPIIYFVAAVLLIIFIYPFIWMISSSLKTLDEIITIPWSFPRKIQFDNFVEAWRISHFGIALRNSILVSTLTVLMVTILSSLSAYAFAHLKFRAKNVLFIVIIGALMVPVQTIIISLFIFLKGLHLTNSIMGLVFPQVALGISLSTFILTGFFKGIPRDLLDAPKIDGCSDFGIFLRIILPLSRPSLSAVIIFQFLGSWNNFLMPLALIQRKSLQTIPLAVQIFCGEYGVLHHYRFAVLTLAIVPVLIIYFIFQKRFVQGMISGAIK